MNRTSKYIDAALQILDYHDRTLAPAVGDRGIVIGEVRGIDESKRQVTGLLSNDSIDRYGEVVLPSAFAKSLDRFMLNPKFMAQHVYGAPDGSPTSIGHWADVKITKEGLIGTAQFLPAGDALADAWWFRFVNKAVRTFSVGFMTRSWEMRPVSIDGETKMIRHFTGADLLEVSAVEIPANADALVRSAGKRDGDGVSKELRAQIETVVKEILTAGPGGYLYAAVEDAIEAYGHAGLSGADFYEGIHGDDDDAPDASPDSEGQSLKTMLRDVLARSA